MSSLIVLLPVEPADPASEFAFALTPDGRAVQDHASAPAPLLPQPRGAGAEVVAVVPVQCLAWHRVDLPKGVPAGSPRLRAALDGLLEEHLLDEPDAVHYAVQPGARGGEAAWIAACDRAWLRRALQVLEQAGRPASRIVPEFAPQDAALLYATGEPQHGSWVGVGPAGVLAAPLAAGSLALLSPPEETPCIADPAVAALAEQLLQRPVELQQPATRWVLAAQGAWDLAQFDFASSGRARALKKLAGSWADLLRAPQWRPARWGALLLVAVNLLGLNAWAWKERSALEAKRAAIRNALTTTFPNVKVVVDPRVQMEREVVALRQATGVPSGRDFESLLAALAMALPPGKQPAGLEYANGELRVRGLALAPDEWSAVAQALRANGFAATPQGDAVVVTQEDVR